MWTCPKCGEQIEDQFDSCGKCAATTVETMPAISAMWRKLAFYFLCGFLFEMALSLLSAILPEGWLSDEIHNFANEFSHHGQD
jgi:hypothetical protein